MWITATPGAANPQDGDEPWKDIASPPRQPVGYLGLYVDDGLLFRAHPGLGREGAMYARDEHGTEHHQVVKLCFIAYLDGIEAANPLGVVRGSHSMECVYVALLNLPLTMRYRMEIGDWRTSSRSLCVIRRRSSGSARVR